MSVARLSLLFCILYFIWVLIFVCEGITSYGENEKNLIGEDDRRGVILKQDIQKDIDDQGKAQTRKRGLWAIGQTNREPYPSAAGYDLTGAGERYPGYGASEGYGITGTGYTFDNGDADGYYRRPIFGTGYGHTGADPNFGHSGSGGNFGHTGSGVGFAHSSGNHGEVTHEPSHGEMFKHLAFKKLLIPLAGLAILGAAAALSSNPVLLQLGTISGRRKRRRRRSASVYNYRELYPENPRVKPISSRN